MNLAIVKITATKIIKSKRTRIRTCVKLKINPPKVRGTARTITTAENVKTGKRIKNKGKRCHQKT
jgi:hypothetical protein